MSGERKGITIMGITSATFMDGRTFEVGMRVEVSSRHGTEGTGTIIGILDRPSLTTMQIVMDEGTEFGRLDRWPVKTGGFFDRLRDHGAAGGEITAILEG